MPEADGFLALSRRLFCSDLWRGRREPFCPRAALVDLLQAAAYGPHVTLYQGKQVALQPGELITNTRELAERWGWSKSKTARFLRQLKDRGTLQTRPAWPKTATSTVPPTVYIFPKYLQHQRPWQPIEVGQESGTGEIQQKQGLPARGWDRNVGQETKRGTGTWDRNNASNTRPNQGEVDQEGGTGVTKSGTGKSQGNIDFPSTLRDRDRIQLSKNTRTTTTLFPELDSPEKELPTFELVGALARIADRFGHSGPNPNPHRGLNVKKLLQLIKDGHDPTTIAHAIRGTRLLAEAGQLPHVPPGSPFAITATLNHETTIEDQSVFSAAHHLSSETDANPLEY